MRVGVRRCVPMLLLLPLAACTQDFSSFHFGEMKPSGNTREPSAAPDAAIPSADARVDVVADAAPANAADAMGSAADGSAGAQDAAQPAPDASAPSAPVDAPPPQSDPAATEDDAGTAPPSLAQQCSGEWPALAVATSTCEGCACNSCAPAVVDCLTVGDAAQRKLCRDVLACAITHHCQLGDCYCATNACGFGTMSGDGPCAPVIEAAAGGKRSRVYELQQANPPPRDQPFVRALAAIGCLYGTDDAAPGPVMPAQCASTCN